MPNVRISDLPLAATPLSGLELMEVTQLGLSKQVTVDELAAIAPGLDATFVTLTANVGLVNERILTAGTGISIVDSGPGLPVTINATGAVITLILTADIVTATPPTTELVTGNYEIWDLDSTDKLASFGFNGNDQLEIINWMEGAAADTNTLHFGFGRAAVPGQEGMTLTGEASLTLVSNSTATGGNAPNDDQIIKMQNRSQTQTFLELGVYGATDSLQLRNLMTGQPTVLEGRFGSLIANVAPMLIANPHGNIAEPYDSQIGGVIQYYGEQFVAAFPATRTRPVASGVFELNTDGAGAWERVLTTSDLGAGSLATLSDVSLAGQAQYDLLFNVDGTNWEDTAGNLIFDSAALALQFAAGYGINMGATPLRVLEVASSGTPSATIEHTSVEVIAEVSTVSNSEVPLTGGTLPLLTEGDEYLLMAVAQHHQGNTGGENVHGADIAVAQASGVPFSNMRDDIEPPACAVASDQGQWFTGLNQILYSVASHGQITLEHSAGAGQTHYVNNAILMAFNLTDFGTENVDWFSTVTAPFVTVTDAGWSNLSPSITVGDGVSDWLIFGSFQTDQPQAGGQIQYGLFDGSVNTEFAMHQFADVADIKSIFFSAVFQGIASTTFQTAARAVAASGNTARIFTSGIYALRLNRFAQYSIQSASGPTSPGSGAEFSLLTDSVVANSSSDWGIFAFVRNQWIGNTLSGTSYGRANINAGGFTTIAGFDTPPQSVVENATNELTPKQLVPRITELTGVVATDTVGAELRWIPPATFGPTRAALYNMVMFTWDTLDTSVNATTLGDPTIGTQIDGVSLSIAGQYTLPVTDGGIGEVLTTDGAGAVTFTPAGVPDPLIIGSINLTSALSTSTLGAPYINVPINIGNSLVGTQGMTQMSRQRIQTKPSAFSFNSTLFINIDGAGTSGSDTIIGGLNSANIEVEFGVAVRFQHALSGVHVAETAAPASGGFLANNQATGAGLERVLTTSDLGGSPVQELEAPSTSIRMSAENTGVVQLRSDGNVTTENRLLRFTFSNETVVGRIGYDAGPDLTIANEVNGANIRFEADILAGTTRLLATLDPDATGASGTGRFEVWDNIPAFPWLRVMEPGSFATRTMSSVQYADALGVQRPAGPAQSTPTLFAGNVTLSINDFQVITRYHDSAITRIFDIPVTLTTVANGCMLAIVNLGTGGVQLRPATGVSVEWWDGAAYQTLVGNGALVVTLPTGRHSLWKISDALYEVVGPGIT